LLNVWLALYKMFPFALGRAGIEALTLVFTCPIVIPVGSNIIAGRFLNLSRAGT